MKNNTYNFDLYKKMQKYRCPYMQNKDWVGEFKTMIENIKKNGFDPNFPIFCNANFKLQDGSHRVSYLYFIKSNFIPFKITNIHPPGMFPLAWFKYYRFTNEELNIIKNEEKILHKYFT